MPEVTLNLSPEQLDQLKNILTPTEVKKVKTRVIAKSKKSQVLKKFDTTIINAEIKPDTILNAPLEELTYNKKAIAIGYILGTRKYKWSTARGYQELFAKMDGNFISKRTPHQTNLTIYIPDTYLMPNNDIRIVEREKEGDPIHTYMMHILERFENGFTYTVDRYIERERRTARPEETIQVK